MNPIEKYLEPVSPDKPCGENLAYDRVFMDLDVKAKGKPETQFSPAEEPNWKEVNELASSLLDRFKHLQLGLLYTLSRLQLEGLPGCRDGLKLLHGWIERYWATLYPQLDPEDNNDPTERVNILQGLSIKAYGDPYQFLNRLRNAPLAESPSLGRLSLNTIAARPDQSQVQAAFRDTAPEVLRARYEAATECRTLVEAMDASIGKLIAAGRGPNFEEIMATLKEIQQCLAPHAGVAAAELGSVPAASPAEAGPASPAPGGFKGAVGSREEVLAALTAVCQYYRRFEPSSPVPFLLTRAQRLVPMDFVQILNDMTPEALEKLKVIIGSGDSSEQKPT